MFELMAGCANHHHVEGRPSPAATSARDVVQVIARTATGAASPIVTRSHLFSDGAFLTLEGYAARDPIDHTGRPFRDRGGLVIDGHDLAFRGCGLLELLILLKRNDPTGVPVRVVDPFQFKPVECICRIAIVFPVGGQAHVVFCEIHAARQMFRQDMAVFGERAAQHVPAGT